MLPLRWESKVLKQAYEYMCYQRDKPPSAPSGCKAGQYRNDDEKKGSENN